MSGFLAGLQNYFASVERAREAKLADARPTLTPRSTRTDSGACAGRWARLVPMWSSLAGLSQCAGCTGTRLAGIGTQAHPSGRR